ncbi:NUDIX domain-containing protein [Polaromonas sp.]|nr:NUDIX domain-containing protein [Candidatus Saccharibacteria bacterium]
MDKPQIQIVDEVDNLIGHKYRAHVDLATDIYRSSSLWLTNTRGQILIAQRKLTKDKDPGLWGPAVSGTIDEGETYESNIVKEMDEEIGLCDVLPRRVTKIYQNSPRKQFICIFAATVDLPLEAFTLQQDEVEAVKWIAATELMKDFKASPDKYVPSMGMFIARFHK